MKVIVMFLPIQISIIISTLFVPHEATDALYSSMNKMFSLIDTEGIMINTLEQYIQAEIQRLESLKKCNERRTVRQNPSTDVEEFASNPLAIFSMIKYLTTDFEELKKQMLQTNYESIIPAMSQKSDIAIPTDDDIHGMILNLIKLQHVYDISADDLMRGNILGQSFNGTLSIEDGIDISLVAWKYNEHSAATDWLNSCLDRIHEDDWSLRKTLWDKLTESYLYMGEKEHAHTSTKNSIHEHWEDRRIQDLKQDLSEELDRWETWDHRSYNSFRACRGDFTNETKTRNLKCRYNHSNTPFLLLAPLKEEEMSIDPKVVIYREALYDSEIELLKSEARSVLRTATVLKNNGADRGPDTQYRPSETAFLENRQTKYQTIWYRLEDLSGLSMNHAEMFQVLNYASGGYYRVHADYLPSETPDLDTIGQRVATALFYLNDVPLGGGTVFPMLKLHVQPVKGSILFWININEDESLQIKTEHAACPVIYGEKWAATQWFRGRGQAYWNSLELRDSMFRWKPRKLPKSYNEDCTISFSIPAFTSEN